MQILLTVLFLFIAMPFTKTTATVDPPFKLVENKNGIALYERWVHYNGNDVREIKIHFIAKKSNAAYVIDVLKDKNSALKWNPNAKQYKLVFTKDDNVWLTYARYKIPWPMNDQDCCLRYRYINSSAKSNSVSVQFESVESSMFPQVENVTRITGTRGSWQVKSESDQLSVTYNIIANKSASVPRWVSDPLIHDNIFKSMKSFRNLLESFKN